MLLTDLFIAERYLFTLINNADLYATSPIKVYLIISDLMLTIVEAGLTPRRYRTYI